MPKKTPFEFHGVALQEGEQLEGGCVFCNHDDRFYVNPETLLWDCKRCGETGNLTEFLRKFHELCLKTTTEQDYRKLAVDRRISAKTLIRNQLAKNFINGEWLVPHFNLKGRVRNLYTYRQIEDKRRLCGTPTLEHEIYGLQSLHRRSDLFIVEGQWDYLALDYLLSLIGKRDQFDILGIPGSQVWKDKWLKVFDRYDTINALFDNDDAGYSGVEKLARKLCIHTEKTAEILIWPESAKDGCDVRDLLNTYKRDAYDYIVDHLHPAAQVYGDLDDPLKLTKSVKPLQCESIHDLMADIEQNLELTDSFRKSILVSLATHVSARFEGTNPLWVFVVGRPSSGKSTICSLISTDMEHTFPFSKITGLHTGMSGGFEFIDNINNKCGVCKDFTTILSAQAARLSEILGEFRDIFDGSSHSFYRNKKSSIKEGIRFSLVCGVTHDIKRQNMAHLGERFLRIECDDDIVDGRGAAMKAMQNEMGMIHGLVNKFDEPSLLARKTLGFLQYKHRQFDKIGHKGLPTISKGYQFKIANLAEIVAALRTVVLRSGYDNELHYIPKSELGARLAVQLQRMSIALAFILDKEDVDDEVLDIVRKLAKDSCNEFSFSVANTILNTKRTLNDIHKRVDLKKATIRRKLEDMMDLGIVTTSHRTQKSSGRPFELYEISPKFREFWKVIK